MLKQSNALRSLQDKLGQLFSVVPLSANQWTLLSVVVAFLGAFFIAVLHDLGLGLLFFALSAISDAIDGAVARARGETSELGGFIDGVADRFVEAAFLFSFMFYPLPVIGIDAKIWLALLVFLGACMPSFMRAYADHKSIISKADALALGGVCERGERLGILLVGLAIGSVYSMEYFVYALIVAVLLSAVTILQRLVQILTLVKQTD